MKLRFKLRTLLIVTALVAVFLGMQSYVESKAKRYLADMREQSDGSRLRKNWPYRLETSIAPMSFRDFLYVRRRVEVKLLFVTLTSEVDEHVRERAYFFSVYCFDEHSFDESKEAAFNRTIAAETSH